MSWRVRLVFALAGLLLALAVVMVARSAYAHDWYPPNCCSGHDCFPIKESDLTPIQNGYAVNASGLLAVGTMVHRSEDGRYHLCTRTGLPDGPPVCVFEPDHGF